MREELYAQCFDELIREVTINCAERGLLLLRVRDEMRMTIAAYQVGRKEGDGELACPLCASMQARCVCQPAPPVAAGGCAHHAKCVHCLARACA